MGVQTIDRAVAVLNWLGNSGEQGIRLVDLQRALGLKRPTVHRILSSLVDHGLVSFDERGIPPHKYNRTGGQGLVALWVSR
jgi:DNA-binding IclR family transcriptional regulator